jgi:hypothetical protein
MVSDPTRWNEARKRISTKISNEDFLLVMELPAKYFQHKYKKLCTCNKRNLRLWIEQLNKYFTE